MAEPAKKRALVCTVIPILATAIGLMIIHWQSESTLIWVNTIIFAFVVISLVLTAMLFGYARSLRKLLSESEKITHELRRRSLALQTSMDGIAILDSSEKFIFINDAHAKIYGYSSGEELIGKTWHVLYDQETLNEWKTVHMPRFRKFGSVRVESQGKRKDGSIFPQEVSLTALNDGGLICVVRDITERKVYEEHERLSKKLLDEIINANPNFIFVKDREGRFVLANRSLAKIYGVSPLELIGKRDADFNANSTEVARLLADDRRVIENGLEIQIYEESITDSQGKLHWLQTVKKPIKNPIDGSTQVLGICNDITELKSLQQQLLHAQKLEAVGQLAGGIAHDFNNLLTGIMGYTSLLKTDSELPKRLSSVVDSIETTAEKAGALTQKLLGFARRGKHKNTFIDVHASIQEALSLLRRTIEENITIKTRFMADRYNIMGDPTQLQQVFLNLAINARDAMLAADGKNIGGILTIATKNVYLDQNHTDDRKILAGEYIEVSVVDSGCGIPEENISRIFEPFFTTKGPDKGTGMGLAMVYGIIKNHGGSIDVESHVGRGTIFRILLPLAENSAGITVKREKVSRKTPVPARGNILLVDDHQVIREVTGSMLRRLGYRVQTASSANEALKLISENGAAIDLMLLDMVMPGMDIRECVRKCKRIRPKLKTVLSTGYVNNNRVQELLNEGLHGFVEKPYDIAKLAEVIQCAMKA